MPEEIINKVANSGLLSFDLEEFYDKREQIVYDLAPNLYMGLILREKDFREFLKTNDWSVYAHKNVAIQCSQDSIVPTWAYMLLTLELKKYAHEVVFGSLEDLNAHLFTKTIEKLDIEPFKGKRVVVKGCSKIPVPTQAYVALTNKLMPYVQSLMFGEPCSTVPLYKKPKE